MHILSISTLSSEFLIQHTTLVYFFSFYCYVDNQDLHSFPTRRSSDLFRSVRRIPRSLLQLIVGVLLTTFGTDRKSTRLNSSHTVISYAVFCLKKKITKLRYDPTPLHHILMHNATREVQLRLDKVTVHE